MTTTPPLPALSCSICSEAFATNAEIFAKEEDMAPSTYVCLTASCHHHICAACMGKLLKTPNGNTCPWCRLPMAKRHDPRFTMLGLSMALYYSHPDRAGELHEFQELAKKNPEIDAHARAITNTLLKTGKFPYATCTKLFYAREGYYEAQRKEREEKEEFIKCVQKYRDDWVLPTIAYMDPAPIAEDAARRDSLMAIGSSIIENILNHDMSRKRKNAIQDTLDDITKREAKLIQLAREVDCDQEATTAVLNSMLEQYKIQADQLRAERDEENTRMTRFKEEIAAAKHKFKIH